jgi:hypothetical protein
MFFNRFAVEREDAFVHIHFGYVNKGGALVDSYSTAISELELSQLKKSTMDYLGSQGAIMDPPATWHPSTNTSVELANHIVMARHGSIAETVIYAFSHWSALQEAKKLAAAEKAKNDQQMESVIVAEGVALLRSSLRVQQHLILLLFTDRDPLLPSE